MLAWLDTWLSLPAVIWLLPVVFLIHDLEEIALVERWMAHHREEILQRYGHLRPVRIMLNLTNVTTRQFTIAVATILAIMVWAAWVGARDLSPGFGQDFYATAVAGLLLNVVTHVVQSLLLGRYTPGVVTALLVVLPYSLYAFYRLDTAGLLTAEVTSWSAVVAALMLPILVPGVLWLARQLGRKTHTA